MDYAVTFSRCSESPNTCLRETGYAPQRVDRSSSVPSVCELCSIVSDGCFLYSSWVTLLLAMRDLSFVKNVLLVYVLSAAIAVSLSLPPLQSLTIASSGDLILPENFSLSSNVSLLRSTIPKYECDGPGGDGGILRSVSCLDAARRLLDDITNSRQRILGFKDRRGPKRVFAPDVVLPYLSLSCMSSTY